MFATEAQARRRARQWPALGAYIARVEIPLDESVQVERSLRNSPGHHTVWGDAAALLAWVTQLVPV